MNAAAPQETVINEQNRIHQADMKHDNTGPNNTDPNKTDPIFTNKNTPSVSHITEHQANTHSKQANTRELIMFGEDWHGLPSSSQHLAKALADEYKIIWVNSIGLRQPSLSLKDFKRALTKLSASFFKTRSSREDNRTVNNRTENLENSGKPCDSNNQVYHDAGNCPDNIHVINIVTWPAPKSQLIRKMCAYFIGKQVGKAMQQQGFSQPDLWLSLPTAVDAAAYIPHQQLIYYCCDDFESLAGVDHKTVKQHEDKLIHQADHIIVSQKWLNLKWVNHDTPEQQKSHVLPHGVDYALFQTPVTAAEDLPKETLIAGFYGSIAEWLDLELIRQVAERLPDWTFVFIGAIKVDIRTLKNCPNIRFLGPRAHQQLPAYSQHWTVSLLPFKDCPQITHCNPLKLREYLAAGSPIVSTPFPASEDYRQHITIGKNAAGFVNALIKLQQTAATPSALSAKHARQETVKDESWAARGATLKTIMGS